jgi:hypothetical protein
MEGQPVGEEARNPHHDYPEFIKPIEDMQHFMRLVDLQPSIG